MKKDKESKQDNDISMNLALGLSIGTLLGVAIDNIGVGMLMGVAVGLCFHPTIGTLKKNSKSFEHKNSFYGFIWIIFGIASGMMSKNTGGSEVQDSFWLVDGFICCRNFGRYLDDWKAILS